MGKYRYKLLEDWTVQTSFRPACDIYSEWMTMLKSGLMTIHQGYTWDGCTLTWDGVPILSMPAGSPRIERLRKFDFYTRATLGSLLHDCLCQHLFIIADACGLSIWRAWQMAADDFKEQLIKDGHKMHDTFAFFVRLWGFIKYISQ